jgi:N-acetylneuraminate synthase/N,N'-diacetyllegionaminate synthase
MNDVNLLAMNSIKKHFGVSIGYSDHTIGIEVPIAAVALGAKVIEKHFTLDKAMDGPDHKASLEPAELKEMVKAIRNIEFAISGSGEKEVSESEMKNIIVARKSIHLNNAMIAGQQIQKKDLVMKRPGDGISPMKIDSVIGKIVSQDLQKDHKLELKDLNN